MKSENLHAAETKFLEAVSWIEKNNDFAEAQKLFLNLVQEFPDFPNAYGYLGWIYSNKLNNPVQAEVYYKQGIEVGPNYVPQYYNYATFLQFELKHNELEKLLEKMLKIPSISKGDVFLQYGLMREYQLKYFQAIKYFKKAIKETTNSELITACNLAINRCRMKRLPWIFREGPNGQVVVRASTLVLIFAILIILLSVVAPLLSK
jgi:tetratricopeptide (TPR) repeat protein